MISILAFSAHGLELGGRIAASLAPDEVSVERCPKGGLAAWTAEHFATDEALVFVGALGIAVRAIAPHVAKKTSDPAVVVVDETGAFAIPVLSGHIGGAVALARRIAEGIGAVPVVTTATDARGLWAVDTWAAKNGYVILNPDRIVDVSSALLDERPVRIINEFPIVGLPPKGLHISSSGDITVYITTHAVLEPDCLQVVVPSLTLGIGCHKGATYEHIEEAVRDFLTTNDVAPQAVEQVASIDVKADEPGIVEFAAKRNLPYVTFTADELASVPGQFNESDFVKQTVGVGNVCERAAVLASDGELVAEKQAYDGVTLALAQKHVFLTFKEI